MPETMIPTSAETRLSFCTIHRLNQNIEELVIDDTTEIDGKMVSEYHQFIDRTHECGCAILENMENNYSYNFSAQLTVGNSDKICATAVLVYRHASARIIASLISMPRNKPWNMRVFYDRDQALNWLNEQLEKPRNSNGITRAASLST